MGTLRAALPIIAVACALSGCKCQPEPDIKGVTSVHAAGADGPAQEPPRTEGPQAVVTASRGKVELSRGSTGSWSVAKVGDRLSAQDALRTEIGEADVAVEG